jgi:uncharacterized protein (TIGR03083 family)
MPPDWTTIHAERSSLAGDLSGLADDRWSTTSLCSEWTVQQVVAHLTATAKMSPVRFFTKFAGAGFVFRKFNDNGVRDETLETPAATLQGFRSAAGNASAPPGPADTPLGEVLVHAEDIRRPLGISHTYPQAAVEQAARFYASSTPIIHGKGRVAGLTLKPTDAGWSIGSGPVVEGPALSLLLAITRRRAALADLQGPGLDELRGRS